MSHYSVVVFHDGTKDVESLLAPYNETDEAYFEDIFYCKGDEMVEKKNELVKKYPDSGYENMSVEEFAEEQCGAKLIGEDYYIRYNPNAKWDWYQYHFSDLYNLIAEKDMDEDGPFLAKDYDLSDDEENYQKYLDEWPKLATEGDGFFKPEYYLTRYGTAEIYAKHRTSSAPYAFVTPDGDWVAPGTVGWFAVDDAEPQSILKYLKAWDEARKKYADCYLDFIDCHI